MAYIQSQDKSLFYQGLAKKGGIIMINKRQIESAVMSGDLTATVKMVSGDVIELSIDATRFGELTFYLQQVEHGSNTEGETK